jgi:hypothetical protein
VVYYWAGDEHAGYALGEVVQKQAGDDTDDSQVMVVPYRHRAGKTGAA